jgi:hypothetical protein
MAIKSIIRSPEGRARREVKVSDIVIHDIRASPLFLPDKRWIAATARYYEDLSLLLAAVRADLELPGEFFVPDLWDTAIKLPAQERDAMLDVWGLGYDLAQAVGYTRAEAGDIFRNDVAGAVFVRVPSANEAL